MDDKELIRVDLLKFRRKAYLSYPEGSVERRNFLKVLLQNELQTIEKPLSQDVVELVSASKNVILEDSIEQGVALFYFSFVSFLISFKIWHHVILAAIAAIVVGVLGLVQIGFVIKEYFKFKHSIRVIEDYTNDMKNQVSRITNDIKRLEGPSGF